MTKLLRRAHRVSFKLLSLCWFINAANCFGWTAWNNNLLQSISDCPTFDGNRTGICVASASECRNSKFTISLGKLEALRIGLTNQISFIRSSGGGRRLGSCYSNQGGINGQGVQYGGQSGYGPPFGPGLGVAVGVCCSSKFYPRKQNSDSTGDLLTSVIRSRSSSQLRRYHSLQWYLLPESRRSSSILRFASVFGNCFQTTEYMPTKIGLPQVRFGSTALRCLRER